MITNTGKGILAKYLLGQAPAYASYIAVGCGPKALNQLRFGISNKAKTGFIATLTSSSHGLSVGQVIDVKGLGSPLDGTFSITAVTTNTFSYNATVSGTISSAQVSAGVAYAYPNFKDKTRLDFEMFRVPIISRGYVNEDNVVKLVLTAELPTEERYEITEVGIFSAGANPAVGAFDSRTLYTFGSGEGWQTSTSGDIQYAFNGGPLDEDENDNIISNDVPPVFYTNADNKIFTNDSRVLKNERCRFLNELVAIVGNYSGIQVNEESGAIVKTGNYIELTDASINLNKNAPSDELRFAFSLINKDGTLDEDPDNVKILVEFSSSDTTEHARLLVDIDNDSFNGVADDSRDFSSNRYFIVAKQLQELSYTSAFNWESVSVIKVYVSVSKDAAASSDYYVCLDGLRLENLSSNNPLYGLTGYSVINNNDSLPIVKAPNTSNFIEFRLSVGVE